MPTATEVREPRLEGWAEVRNPALVLRTGEMLQSPRLVQPRPLFADSLLASGKQDRNRRQFATVLSFAFQGMFIGILLIVPLMFTEAPPPLRFLPFLAAPPPPPPPPPPAVQAVAKVVRKTQSDLLSGGQLRTPIRIPEKVQMIREEEAPPPLPSMGGVAGGGPGGKPGGEVGGGIGGIISPKSRLGGVPQLLPPTLPQQDRISQAGNQGFVNSESRTQVSALGVGGSYLGRGCPSSNYQQGRGDQRTFPGEGPSHVGASCHWGSETVALSAILAER